MQHISLFNGIGGFQLAAAWMGWQNVASCEIDEWCNRVTKYHFPDCIQHGDIKTTDFTIYRGQCDILTGGFPCQPYSAAGLRKGTEDERHLWPQMLRAIREIQPRWVVGENVRGLTNWNGGVVFDEVQADLEAIGYEVTPFLLPACAVNAPHRRDRIWFVAYAASEQFGRQGRSTSVNNSGREACQHEQKRCEIWDIPAAIGNIGATPHTHSDGQQRGNSQHEEHTSERGQHAQCNTQQSNGNGATTNPTEQGRKEREQSNRREDKTKIGTGMDDGTQRLSSNGIVTNTNGSGLRGEINGTGSTGRLAETGAPDDWENFPTQPPVCGGDDGLPRELDGITFSKWRNNSVKAYGNAIVPQVALQIFKAINEYENILCQTQ